MKSIVEEASSIAKAVEKGWIRAGKPQEFSVKIFEDVEKNFLGMTSKPAKVAIFFEQTAPSFDKTAKVAPKPQREKSFEKAREQREPRVERRDERRDSRRDERPDDRRSYRQERTDRRPRTQQRDRDERKPRETQDNNDDNRRTGWTPEMVDIADLWMQSTLREMNAHNISFSSRVSGNALRYTFSKRITKSEDSERLLFSSFANLILATLRNKFKREFRYFKVVLNTSE